MKLQQIRKKTIEGLDKNFRISWINLFSNFAYGILFAILFGLLFLGLRLNLVEGFFQLMVFIVMFAFCFREADRHFSNLPGVFLWVGMAFLLTYVLTMVGYNTMFFIDIILTLLSSFIFFGLIYNFWLRSFLLKKWKLPRCFNDKEKKK